MEQDFYRDRLARHGLDGLVPDAGDGAEVRRIIYDELCRGVASETSRASYRQVIARLIAAGAQGVILGCTEIELLISAADRPVPVYPTTRLQVEAPSPPRSVSSLVANSSGGLRWRCESSACAGT